MAKKVAAPKPWQPIVPPESITGAIKALHAGNANAGQQQAALKWIIEVVCGAYEMSYQPLSERDTTFAEGKRFVGNQIIKEIKMTTPERRGG